MVKISLLLLCAFVLSALGSVAHAATCQDYTYILQNSTTADANQVMQDFEDIRTCAAPSISPSFTGNVGIGTANPSDPLEVVAIGPGSTGGRATVSNSAADAQGNSAAIGFRTSNSFASGYYSGSIIVTQAGAANYNSEAMAFNLYTGSPGFGTEIMRLQQNGNVGIGTTTPVAKMDIWNYYGSGIDSLRFSYNDGTLYTMGIQPYVVGASNIGYRFATSNGASTATPLALTGAGNVGIGMTSPSYPLDVVGDIRTSTCLRYPGGTWGSSCTSDAALKRNVEPFALGLSAVVGLKPVNFYYNGLGGNPDDGVRQLGLIAQEVEQVAPELVGTRLVTLRPTDKRQTPVKTVNYGALNYMLINAVKELNAKVDSLKASDARYATQVATLRAAHDDDRLEIAELRAEVAYLMRSAKVRTAAR